MRMKELLISFQLNTNNQNTKQLYHLKLQHDGFSFVNNRFVCYNSAIEYIQFKPTNHLQK